LPVPSTYSSRSCLTTPCTILLSLPTQMTLCVKLYNLSLALDSFLEDSEGAYVWELENDISDEKWVDVVNLLLFVQVSYKCHKVSCFYKKAVTKPETRTVSHRARAKNTGEHHSGNIKWVSTKRCRVEGRSASSSRAVRRFHVLHCSDVMSHGMAQWRKAVFTYAIHHAPSVSK
jgi:hypothetical protein